MRLRSKTAASLTLAGALVGFGGFWAIAEAPAPLIFPEHPVSVLFVGDLMLDRNVARAAQSYGIEYLFASSSAMFIDADLRVANLEGTITTHQSVSQLNHTDLRFTFDTSLAHDVLGYLGVSAVSSANNHSLDFGQSGLSDTRGYLSQWGVGSFGSPFNSSGTLSTKLTARGRTICLVGYMQLFNPATTTVVSEIETLRPTCNTVVVFAHWGVEYSTHPTEAQMAAAHDFIDAGADMVIGAHPHVVEPLEIYKGHAIIYSLGNFMFDQDFSWETEHSLAVRADFYRDKTTLTFIPLSIQYEHSAPAEGQDKEAILGMAGLTVDTVTLP